MEEQFILFFFFYKILSDDNFKNIFTNKKGQAIKLDQNFKLFF